MAQLKSMRIKIVLFIASGMLVILLLPLLIGVWLPDVLVPRRHVIAKYQVDDGNHFEVVQYWNRSDFYNTELLHSRPDGTKSIYVLDGDDSKSWGVPIDFDSARNIVSVRLGRARTLRLVVDSGELIRY
jgi:hypothetical protein